MAINEEWKTVPGTDEMLEVSSQGRVRSLLRGTPYVLKCQADKKGYLRLRVTISRRKMSFKLHRLVAQTFIPNPDGLPQVNHKDGNKSNNSVDNLEWCTNKDNAHHAIEHGLWESVMAGANRYNAARRTPIVATKEGQIIRFASVTEAQDYFDSKHISDVLKGKRAHVKGWHFFYESEVIA